MTPKEYLSQYYWLKKDIESKREEIKQLETLAEYVSPNPEAGGGGGAADKVGNLVTKIVDEKDKLNRQIEELIAKRDEVKSVIRDVSDPVFRRLLTLRYINGYTFERIAIEMFYTYKWVCVLHGRALAAVDVPAKKST